MDILASGELVADDPNGVTVDRFFLGRYFGYRPAPRSRRSRGGFADDVSLPGMDRGPVGLAGSLGLEGIGRLVEADGIVQ